MPDIMVHRWPKRAFSSRLRTVRGGAGRGGQVDLRRPRARACVRACSQQAGPLRRGCLQWAQRASVGACAAGRACVLPPPVRTCHGWCGQVAPAGGGGAAAQQGREQGGQAGRAGAQRRVHARRAGKAAAAAPGRGHLHAARQRRPVQAGRELDGLLALVRAGELQGAERGRVVGCGAARHTAAAAVLPAGGAGGEGGGGSGGSGGSGGVVLRRLHDCSAGTVWGGVHGACSAAGRPAAAAAGAAAAPALHVLLHFTRRGGRQELHEGEGGRGWQRCRCALLRATTGLSAGSGGTLGMLAAHGIE